MSVNKRVGITYAKQSSDKSRDLSRQRKRICNERIFHVGDSSSFQFRGWVQKRSDKAFLSHGEFVFVWSGLGGIGNCNFGVGFFEFSVLIFWMSKWAL